MMPWITPNRFLFTILWIIILAVIVTPVAQAKKKKKSAEQAPPQSVSEQRIQALSPDDARKFEALTKKQQKLIRDGEIEEGFNAWMVELALGKPFYATEHHPIYQDYEEVWLYTRPDGTQNVVENRILDRQTNWPSLHRITTTKICQVAGFFVLWDRGVVVTVHQADRKVHGTCTIETKEAILPIVDGKPVEPH